MKHRVIHLLLLLVMGLPMLGMTGCSTAFWYDSFQGSAQDQCAHLKTDLDRRKCLGRTSEGYETYKKKVEAAGTTQPLPPRPTVPEVVAPVVPSRSN